jgi:hypothetical protein
MRETQQRRQDDEGSLTASALSEQHAAPAQQSRCCSLSEPCRPVLKHAGGASIRNEKGVAEMVQQGNMAAVASFGRSASWLSLPLAVCDVCRPQL